MIEPRARDALSDLLGDAIAWEVDTSHFTSLRVGGPADAVATPRNREQLAGLLRICARFGVPQRVLGRGFNTIVRDEGVDGVLIRLARFRRIEARPGSCLLVESGVSHSTLGRFCREHGLAGLEFGAGIPGSVGGWIAMNAGIGARETKDVVRELEVISPTGRRRHRLERDSLRFVYRGLRGLAVGSVLVSARLAVRVADPDEVKAEMDRLLARRAGTQPLDQPSCGSVFKNPPGAFAGALIEAAGLKGFRVGGAEISTIHANFIVNAGGATATDVLALIRRAREAVRGRTGIRLEPEVRIWGRTA